MHVSQLDSLQGNAVAERVVLDSELIERRIHILRQEHGDLEAAIVALQAAPAIDQLQIARIKKRKLRIKDEISQLEDMLIPDIIA